MSKISLDCGVATPVTWVDPEFEVVWLTEERTYAALIQQGAYFSRVRYRRGNKIIEEDIENDEYKPFGEHAIDYQQE